MKENELGDCFITKWWDQPEYQRTKQIFMEKMELFFQTGATDHLYYALKYLISADSIPDHVRDHKIKLITDLIEF